MDRGAVLVELALVLPMLALVFLVVAELGLAIREHQVLQNAAREAARYSALPGNLVSPLNPNATLAAIQQRVVTYCQQEQITITQPPDTITVDQHHLITIGSLTVEGSQVTVVHSHPFLLGGAGFLPAGPLTLRANAVFRNMY